MFRIPAPSSRPGQWIRFRLGFVFVCFVLAAGGIAFRLVQLQVLHNPELDSLAERQFRKIGKKAPYRLPIYDRNHEELAVSIPAASVFARPKQVRQKRTAARTLAKLLGGTPAHWLGKLRSGRSFVWLHRKLSEEAARQLAEKKLAGIFIEPENKRIYPNGELAAPVLGFTDVDGNGLAGLELSLNDEILRPETRYAVPRDGRGNPSYLDAKYRNPDDGNGGIYVTIDRRLQTAVEEELDRALAESAATAALAVVMDPYTGEIYAMGQRPTFDPNRASEYPAPLFSNHLISHLYEPGSTMKPVLAAEAIQEGLLTPKSSIYCEKGQMAFGRRRIHEAEANHRFGWLSLENIIRYSSNIGAVKVAEKLGVAKVRSTLDKFGLTAKTGISLPGEAYSGPRGDDFWRPIYLATVGFGQGVSVTPLQMLSAYAPFANGGYLVRPRILLRENGSSTTDGRRILSPPTVKAMRDIMVGVTEMPGATGAPAYIPDMHVAGKTGTAQKYESGTGYEGGKFVASFLGYLPADQPELLIGVWVDEPRHGHFGGQVAGPIFKRIAERSLQILDRVPKRSVPQTNQVVASAPASKPVPPVPRPDVIVTADGKWLMPDLRGASARDALQGIGTYLPNLRMIGTGYVESQVPKPGTLVTSDSPVVLHFSPAG